MNNICLVQPTQSLRFERKYPQGYRMARNTYFVVNSYPVRDTKKLRLMEFMIDAPIASEKVALPLQDNEAILAFKRGAGLLAIGLAGAAATLVVASPLLPLGAGAAMFAGGIISANAVERIRGG